MIIRRARESDFAHLETFVWQAVFPAFDREGLTAEQRAENDELVEGARTRIIAALGDRFAGVFVAIDPQLKTLAGYVVADGAPRAYAEVRELIVKRGQWGKGVGEALLDEALEFIGRHRAVSLAVRYYNARALAFFKKHGFVDTGETTGDHAIPRSLLLREAEDEPMPARPPAGEAAGDDFPTAADEPVFAELPDYRLAVDDEEPLFPTGTNALTVTAEPEEDGHTSLTDRQLSELADFIARARAKKAAPPSAPPAPDTVAVGENVDLEVTRTAPGDKPRFAFAFAPSSRPPVEPPRPAAPPPAHQACPNCATELPLAARFCYNCGFPQPVEADPTDGGPPTGAPPPPEEALVLDALGNDDPETPEVLDLTDLSDDAPGPDPIPLATPRRSSSGGGERNTKTFTLSELKTAFREQLQDRVAAYFGPRRVRAYYDVLEADENFQQLRDGSLTNLLQWINGGERSVAETTRRLDDTLADLTEYFIVETAGDLSGRILPQRLLRYQSVDWDAVDLFRLVMDYLDFENEAELVHTDFVSMPARALRNATTSFLRAGKDERVFFICDQSLISAAKNGFAVSDSGLYWKNILQPAAAVLFNELSDVRIRKGHLELDRQFFNAGASLNLKVAVLMDKLKRR